MSFPPFAALVEWRPLLEAVEISTVVGLALLVVAALAVVTSLRAQDRRRAGHEVSVVLYGALTVLCVGLMAGAVAVGIWAMAQ